MKRRLFIAGLAGAAAVPLSAHAQTTPLPRVGFLNTQTPETFALYVASFQGGLKEGGFTEGHNVNVEYRWGRGRNETLPALAGELAALQPTVIVTSGGEPAAVAARPFSIPIVFLIGGDPVKMGLVQSFNRPGGHLTGMTQLTLTLDPKRLGFLRELVGQSRSLALLANPKFPGSAERVQYVLQEAKAIGLDITVVAASTEAEIESAVAGMDHHRIGGVLVASDPFYNSHRTLIIDGIARKRMPAIYEWREFTAAGGLMSYGTHLPDAYRQAGLYAARVLKGERPAEMPVLQPTKFQFVLNMKTAKALGLAIPPGLLALADEVIE